jgi:cytochrome P450
MSTIAEGAAAPSRRSLASALRNNSLAGFSPRAFEEDFVHRRRLGRDQLVVSRPEAIRHILVDNADNYVRSPVTIRLLGPLLGQGLFIAAGEEWKRQRRTIAPAFAPRTVPLFARRVAEVAGETVAGLAARAGEPVDLLAAMQGLALEAAGRSLFSLKMTGYAPQMRGLLREYAARLGRPSLLDFWLPVMIPTPRDVLRHLFRRRWLRLIRRIVAERRRRGPQGAEGDLFDLFASARDPETGAAVSAAQLADQVATMIVAGHETTAIALFWSLYLAAGAPDVQQAIAAEADALDLGPEGANEALPQLVYTRAVVQEALRLYPPAFTIVRQARADDAAAGIAIPRRAVVLMAPWVLHRHRRLWTDPERFDPGRFLPGAPAPDRFAYLPFGIGPRICIGAQFAMTEAVLVLATIVRAFRVARIGTEPVTPRAIVLTLPDHPPLFSLHPRG